MRRRPLVVPKARFLFWHLLLLLGPKVSIFLTLKYQYFWLESTNIFGLKVSAMLTFTDTNYFNVPIDPCFEPFPRLQVSKDGKRALLTEGTNSVSLYEISSGRSLKNWTFSPSAPLSCPVVYDDHSDKFVSVQNHTDVRLMRLEDEESHDVRKLKFKRRIACLLTKNNHGSMATNCSNEGNHGSMATNCSNEGDASEVVVMYQDGHMNLLTEAVNNRRNPIPQGVEEFVNGDQITLVRVLDTGRESSFDVGVVTLVDGELWYHIVSMDIGTQVTKLLLSHPVESEFIVYNISQSGTFGGVKITGDIVLITSGNEEIHANIVLSQIDTFIHFLFFPTTENVVGIILVSSDGNEILTVVDLLYQNFEENPLEREITKNFINVTDHSLYFITTSSVVEKRYNIEDATIDFALKSRARKMDDSALESDSMDGRGSLVGRLKKKPKISNEFDTFVEEVSKLSTGEICSKVASMVSKLSFIPEHFTVHCIKRVLMNDPSLNESETSDFFDLLIRTRFNESKMIQYIQEANLKPEESIEIINLLMSKLNQASLISPLISNSLIRNPTISDRKDAEKTEDGANQLAPSSNLMDWISLMMNASFKKIIISGSTYEEKLASLSARLDEYHKYCLASIEMKKTLESLLRKQGLFHPSTDGGVMKIPEYCIETIIL